MLTRSGTVLYRDLQFLTEEVEAYLAAELLTHGGLPRRTANPAEGSAAVGEPAPQHAGATESASPAKTSRGERLAKAFLAMAAEGEKWDIVNGEPSELREEARKRAGIKDNDVGGSVRNVSRALKKARESRGLRRAK